MTTISGVRIIAAVVLWLCGCGPDAPPGTSSQTAAPPGSLFAAAPRRQWRLPNELREISGLAASPDGRVFAHNDERATIYEVDAHQGRIVASFAVGAPERGDFEGLAITPDGDFWLTTSTGQLYRFRRGENGARVPFERFDSGLAEICEIEGLAYRTAKESLILACKENHARDMRNVMALYAWRPGGEAQLWRSLPGDQIATAAGVRAFRPSAIEFDPASGRSLVLSARWPALAEFDDAGNLVAARALRSGHPQAEGVTILADGSLLVADEGGNGRALLSVYGRAP
jgi:uncharacterized protein YjiK